jgi:diguanylate cyclase (GGDEF)-like protein/hemerythrin-like metal-binding protein/PAS domain S-box-containing protein
MAADALTRPIDFLKIDMSFIRHLTTDPGDAAIVQSTIAMAHLMGTSSANRSRSGRLIALVSILGIAMLLLSPLSAFALDNVTVQLPWTHGFQFAGYYAAKERGYYRDAGLDVHFEEGASGIDAVERVVLGQAHFSIGSSGLLLARASGKPVVALAAIFQHSPLVLIARQQSDTQSIHDLVGTRVMIEPDDAEILAYFKYEGITADRLVVVEHTLRLQDLVDGKVDAMTGYVFDEPEQLDRLHFPYQMYTPRSAGIDFYADNLFTSEREIEDHPARVRAFRAASLRGWQYAMEHPDEIIDLILTRYHGVRPREHYAFEATQMRPLIRADLIEVGYMNPGRWCHIAEVYAEVGLLPAQFSLDGFLYDPNPKIDLTWVYTIVAATLGIVCLVGGIATYIHRINRRLGKTMVEVKQAHQRLRISEERHRLLADNASDVIWTMDLNGRFTYVSPSVERLRGYTPAEAMQQSMEQSLAPGSLAIAMEGFGRTIAAVQAGLPVENFRGELEQPCKDGSTVWTEVTAGGLHDASGRFVELLGISRDISERKRYDRELRQARDAAETANRALQIANAELHQLATTDALTGAWNRRHFEQVAEVEITQAQRYGVPLSLMIFDIDHFKSINDRYGHQAGDQVLVGLTQLVRRHLRAADLLARWGGEEFVVMMPHCGEEEAIALADKVRGLVAGTPFPTVGRVTASFGVAAVAPEETLDVWLKRVDDALYRAKEGGRNRVVAGEAKAPDQDAISLHLRWRDSYTCGEPAIDEEHRELFRLVNEILDLAIAEPPPAVLLVPLDALIGHVTGHFAHEEDILQRRGYADLARHAGLHRHLVEHALDLRRQAETGSLEFGKLVEFLSRDVVVLHLLREDRAFYPLFAPSDSWS